MTNPTISPKRHDVLVDPFTAGGADPLFAWSCSCGERSRTVASEPAARADATAHVQRVADWNGRWLRGGGAAFPARAVAKVGA